MPLFIKSITFVFTRISQTKIKLKEALKLKSFFTAKDVIPKNHPQFKQRNCEKQLKDRVTVVAFSKHCFNFWVFVETPGFQDNSKSFLFPPLPPVHASLFLLLTFWFHFTQVCNFGILWQPHLFCISSQAILSASLPDGPSTWGWPPATCPLPRPLLAQALGSDFFPESPPGAVLLPLVPSVAVGKLAIRLNWVFIWGGGAWF